MKTSSFSRSIELLKIASKVGLKEALSGNLKSRIDQAIIIAEGLSNLKGAAMKAGQLLSLELADYFPKEAVDIISKLNSSASYVDFSKIELILKNELGLKKYKSINSIHTIPIGSASIGQVHKAEYQGHSIAIKVQYPNVANSIESDVKILKRIAKSFCTLTGRNMDLTPLFNEFSYILSQEVNYLKEAELQMRYFHSIAKINLPINIKYIVPKVIPKLSTEKVLTMTWQNGIPLKEWIEKNNSLTKREAVAHGFLNLYFNEFFSWGLVQTDPNYGNFLINEIDDCIEIILLDFGAVKEYSNTFIQNYITLLNLVSQDDKKSLYSHAIDFEIIDKRESEEAFEALYHVLKVAVRPFFSKKTNEDTHSLFDFSDAEHNKNSNQAAKELSKVLKYSPPPYNLIFLHRKLAGIYSILKKLGVTLDVSSYWQQMLTNYKNT